MLLKIVYGLLFFMEHISLSEALLQATKLPPLGSICYLLVTILDEFKTQHRTHF